MGDICGSGQPSSNARSGRSSAPAFAPVLPQLRPPQPDEHLHDARELVLRASGVLETEATRHAENVDGGGALHRGPKGRRAGELDEAAKRACPAALRDGKEVVAIASRASSAALGESERDRGGGAFELISQGGTCALRQRGDHRGEFERDVKAIEAFVVEHRCGFRRARSEGGGGRVGCVRGREIQCRTPIKRHGTIAVLTLTDGDAPLAWRPAVSRPRGSNRRDRRTGRGLRGAKDGPTASSPRSVCFLANDADGLVDSSYSSWRARGPRPGLRFPRGSSALPRPWCRFGAKQSRCEVASTGFPSSALSDHELLRPRTVTSTCTTGASATSPVARSLPYPTRAEPRDPLDARAASRASLDRS